MTYKVVAYIDELDYVVAENLTEEELEEFLQRLTRKQDFKDVRRFDLIEETQE